VRAGTADRYRQWLTHKLSTWWGQFGESGCVGCGRCTTWCPVGIDFVAEAGALALEGSEATAAGPAPTAVFLRSREVTA
jgi:ferredoxin